MLAAGSDFSGQDSLSDLEKRPFGLFFRRTIPADLLREAGQDDVFTLSPRQPTGRNEGKPSPQPPHPFHQTQPLGRRRFPEQLLPPAKSNHRKDRRREVQLLPAIFSGFLLCDGRRQIASSLHRFDITPLHRKGRPEKMEIMGVVAVGILAGWVLTGQVLFIDVGCLLIPFHCFVVLPDPHVNVGGHMNEMACAWHKTRQPLRTGQGPFRLR